MGKDYAFSLCNRESKEASGSEGSAEDARDDADPLLSDAGSPKQQQQQQLSQGEKQLSNTLKQVNTPVLPVGSVRTVLRC